jgi:hypothetical protein
MEYNEMLRRLEYIRNVLNREAEKTVGNLNREMLNDIFALDKAILICKEQQ